MFKITNRKLQVNKTRTFVRSKPKIAKPTAPLVSKEENIIEPEPVPVKDEPVVEQPVAETETTEVEQPKPKKNGGKKKNKKENKEEIQ